jgi:hypothetical protein
MTDLKRVKILSWTDGDDGRRFGWTTVTVAEALKSSEKYFRCAACDGPVKLVSEEKSRVRWLSRAFKDWRQMRNTLIASQGFN